jgi:hypothetical protein
LARPIIEDWKGGRVIPTAAAPNNSPIVARINTDLHPADGRARRPYPVGPLKILLFFEPLFINNAPI